MLLSEEYKNRLKKLAGIITEITDIENEPKCFFEDYRYEYNGNYIPSKDVISTAQNALNIVSKNKLVLSDGSNEGSGLYKAKSIVNGEPMTHAQVKRMKAFFDNNYKNREEERAKGLTLNNSALLQSWDLWGGDAGMNWSENIIKQNHSKNDSSKTIRGASGIRTKNLMNPLNTRIHSAKSKIQNSI